MNITQLLAVTQSILDSFKNYEHFLISNLSILIISIFLVFVTFFVYIYSVIFSHFLLYIFSHSRHFYHLLKLQTGSRNLKRFYNF